MACQRLHAQYEGYTPDGGYWVTSISLRMKTEDFVREIWSRCDATCSLDSRESRAPRPRESTWNSARISHRRVEGATRPVDDNCSPSTRLGSLATRTTLLIHRTVHTLRWLQSTLVSRTACSSPPVSPTDKGCLPKPLARTRLYPQDSFYKRQVSRQRMGTWLRGVLGSLPGSEVCVEFVTSRLEVVGVGGESGREPPT